MNKCAVLVTKSPWAKWHCQYKFQNGQTSMLMFWTEDIHDLRSIYMVVESFKKIPRNV